MAVNPPFTKAIRLAKTSFPKAAATTPCYSRSTKKGESAVFSIMRVIVLLACAYAGTAVAALQSEASLSSAVHVH